MEKVFLGLSLFSYCSTLLLLSSKFINLPQSVIDLCVFISAHELLHHLFLSSHCWGVREQWLAVAAS